MKVQITLDIPKLKTTEEAQKFATDLVNHIAENFNEDYSIKSFWTRVPKKGKTA